MLIPTHGFWVNRCKPLIELGVNTWNEAFHLGLINETELNFCAKQVGEKIPNQDEFNLMQETKLINLRRLI